MNIMELAPGMGPATRLGNLAGSVHFVVTGIGIGL